MDLRAGQTHRELCGLGKDGKTGRSHCLSAETVGCLPLHLPQKLRVLDTGRNKGPGQKEVTCQEIRRPVENGEEFGKPLPSD